MTVDSGQFEQIEKMVWATVGTTISALTFGLLSTFIGLLFMGPGIILASISAAFPDNPAGFWSFLVIGGLFIMVGGVVLLPNVAFFSFWLSALTVLGFFVGGIALFLFMIILGVGGSGIFVVGSIIAIIVAIVLIVMVLAGVAFTGILGLIVFAIMGGVPAILLSPMLLIAFLLTVGLALIAFLSFAFVAIFILLVMLSPLILIAVPIWLWADALTYEGDT